MDASPQAQVALAPTPRRDARFASGALVFARGIDAVLKAARSLDTSTVLVNDHTASRTDGMPFAGRHQFGYGVGGMLCTTHNITREKLIDLGY